MAFRKSNIEQFLLSRQWEKVRTGNLFDFYKPPAELHLGNTYELEIPRDENKNGFEKYVSSLIFVIADLYNGKISTRDLEKFFSKSETILSVRIYDDDTNDGSIQLERFSKAIDNLKLVFKQTVTFIVSKKPIFGQSKFEAESFVKQCRALQTETGSFVAKIQLPSETINEVFSNFNSNDVPDKLFSILEFTNNEIIKSKTPIVIDKEYFDRNIASINIELLSSIRDFVHQADINNVSFKFENNTFVQNIDLESIKPRVRYFNKYIRDLKNILLEESPLEIIGYVKRLYSISPQKSELNEITIEGEIANKIEKVRVILNNAFYRQAIEAHGQELKVKVVGIAKSSQTQYLISNPEIFEILT